MDTEENKHEQPQYGQYAPQPIEPQSDGGTTPEKNSGVVNLLSGDMKRKTCAIACAVALIAGCGIGFGIAWPTLRHSAEVAESADIIAHSNAKYVEQLEQIKDNQEKLDKIDDFEEIKAEAENSAKEIEDSQAKIEELNGQIESKKSELDGLTSKITEAEKNTIGDGVWQVGTDIAAGTYRADSQVGSRCYWEITVNGDIAENDIPGGGYPQVTVSDGQQLKISNCGTFTKQ